MKKFSRQGLGQLTMCAVAAILVVWQSLPGFAQARQSDDALRAQRDAMEKELESLAIIDRKVMVPMRDGKRMQADLYRPKDQSKKTSHHLRPHTLQLQLLGHRTRSTTRHEE